MADKNVKYLIIDTSVAYAASNQATRPAKGDMLLLQYILRDRACYVVMADAEEWPTDLYASDVKEMPGLFEEWRAEIKAFSREKHPTFADLIFLEWWATLRSQRKLIEERELASDVRKQVRRKVDRCKHEILVYMQSKEQQGQKEAADLRRMGEDFHLVKAALIANALSSSPSNKQGCHEIIFSRDGEVRVLFANAAATATTLRPLVWVHMNTDKPLQGCTKGGQQAVMWLTAGAPFDQALTLEG